MPVTHPPETHRTGNPAHGRVTRPAWSAALRHRNPRLVIRLLGNEHAHRTCVLAGSPTVPVKDRIERRKTNVGSASTLSLSHIHHQIVCTRHSAPSLPAQPATPTHRQERGGPAARRAHRAAAPLATRSTPTTVACPPRPARQPHLYHLPLGPPHHRQPASHQRPALAAHGPAAAARQTDPFSNIATDDVTSDVIMCDDIIDSLEWLLLAPWSTPPTHGAALRARPCAAHRRAPLPVVGCACLAGRATEAPRPAP
jgi:hypothetical protein